jgi:hypothetical protein
VYVDDYFIRTRGHASLGHPAYTLAMPPPDPAVGALALREALYPSVLAQWGVESSYDLDQQGLFPKPLAELSRFLRIVEGTPTHVRLLRMGAVRRVATLHTEGLGDLRPVAVLPGLLRDPLRIWEVPDPLPRAYAVGAARAADGAAALAALRDGFDVGGQVLLPDRTLGGPPGRAGQVQVTDRRADRVRLAADLDRDGYVVLVDAFDPGWRVTVDGRRAEALRANVAFRAVEVPRGRHAIEWVYRPRSVFVGLALSLAGTGIAVVLLLRGRRDTEARAR